MFGGVLGALSQKQSSTAQRRREDVERKQQEKLKAQEEEDEEEKRRKYEELMEARRKSQWDWEERSLSVKHRAIMARAEFFKTEAEPSLYWMPFEMRESEQKRKGEQLKRAEEECEDERAEFEERKRKALGESTPPISDADRVVTSNSEPSQESNKLDGNVDAQIDVAEPASDHEKDSTETAPKTNGSEEKGSSKELDHGKDTMEDHEEMVMEAGEGEDPVIY